MATIPSLTHVSDDRPNSTMWNTMGIKIFPTEMSPCGELISAIFPPNWSIKCSDLHHSVSYFDETESLRIIMMWNHTLWYSCNKTSSYTTFFVDETVANALKKCDRLEINDHNLKKLQALQINITKEKDTVHWLKNDQFIPSTWTYYEEYFAYNNSASGDFICKSTIYVDDSGIAKFETILKTNQVYCKYVIGSVTIYTDNMIAYNNITLQSIPAQDIIKMSTEDRDDDDNDKTESAYLKFWTKSENITVCCTKDSKMVSAKFPEEWSLCKYVEYDCSRNFLLAHKSLIYDASGCSKFYFEFDNKKNLIIVGKMSFTFQCSAKCISRCMQQITYETNYKNETDIINSSRQIYYVGSVIAYTFDNGQCYYDQQMTFWNDVSYSQQQANSRYIKRKTQFDKLSLIGFFDSIESAKSLVNKCSLHFKGIVTIKELPNGMSEFCKDHLEQLV